MEKFEEQMIKTLCRAYGFSEDPVECRRYGSGHINDTFAVFFENGEKYILQRINRFVFREPVRVMENIRRVTDFLQREIHLSGGDPQRETLCIVQGTDGKDYFCDDSGEFWRCYLFIDDAHTCEVARSPRDMYEAGKTFGRFQRLLAEYPASGLHVTIPDFHNTKVRFRRFLEVLSADPMDRKEEALPEIEFLLSHREEMERLTELLEQGQLPLRVTHNDTKLNNVLLDCESGAGLCAADLDTVMPGLSLHDFGDAIRFGTNPSAEDEQDLSKVFMDEGLFEAYAKGYLEETKDLLTPLELSLLPLGAKVITLECGMRFLMDYLEGDIYFRIRREKQNLDRSRTQFQMARDMEMKWDRMTHIINKFIE